MEQLIERVCGLDVHKETVAPACGSLGRGRPALLVHGE
jgi:hypothetical protein